MSFAVVMEGMTLITFVIVIAGGKQKRESGWKILTGLLVFVASIQCTAMALVVGLLPFFFAFQMTADLAGMDKSSNLS